MTMKIIDIILFAQDGSPAAATTREDSQNSTQKNIKKLAELNALAADLYKSNAGKP